ncbi:TlpA family protein disulfide reductase [Thioclava sp. FR2]|uniref:TlpA family protein disulfide reductase n=1 Tax=Thioclava sp. FR2 TaxID=3445780 RepID=UPI003EBF0664
MVKSQGGNIPSQYFGLNVFLDALHAFAQGDAARAMTLTENGGLEFPDQIGLTRFFGALSAQTGLAAVSRHLGRPFPHAYRLPCLDPFRQWPAGPEVSLTDSLKQMRPGQVLLVYVLGPYRTNGPFQDELRGLMPLYAHAPDKIAAIHLITSHEDKPSSWRDRNQIEDQARALGLPLRVLHDPSGLVEQALQLSSCPSLYVLDHNGKLLATEGMTDEDGYWLALHRMTQT